MNLISRCRLIGAAFLFAVTANANSNPSAKGSWSVSNPFEQKVFIENKGQYDLKSEKPADIKYGVNNLGTEIYFTPKGLFYRIEEQEMILHEEHEYEKDKRKPGKEEGEEREIKTKLNILNMEWVGANPNVQIFAEGEAADYYNFCDPKNPKGQGINNVKAFNKITYKNLYPNIDVEYVFQSKDSKTGVKYTIILHPGADASLIQMKWKGYKKHNLDADGNIHFNLHAGEIVDHAPVTWYQNTKQSIATSFNEKNGTVSFNLGAYDKTQTVIIDPWTVNPNFPQNNKAYDITKDGLGNIYVFGGKNPYLLKKYDSAGNPIWTYTSPFTGWYGDLAVHPTGESYITEGYSASNSFGAIARVNANGAQVWYTQQVQLELWSLAFNCTYSVLTVAGGVWQARTSTVNTSNGTLTGTITFVNTGETRSMTQAPTGNFYHLCISGANSVASLTSANALVWNTPSGYGIGYGTPQYNNSYSTMDAGFNGIACDNNFVYTIDGITLTKKDIITGATMGTAVIPGGTNTGNGGVFIDACGNVYVGSQTQIHKFAPNLTLSSSTAAPGAVYCLANGVGATDILSCGNGFIASVNIANICPINLTLNTTGAGGCAPNSGTATIVVTGGTGPYTYSWSPGGQTTSTITGLSSGTYIVTVTDATSCVPFTDTITISTGSGFSLATAVNNNVSCNNGSNGSAAATPSGGNGPYTYVWTPSNQTTQTATGMPSGTYTVVVTDASGCSSTQTVIITQPTPLAATMANTAPLCNGGSNGSATVTASGGTGPYTYLWNNAQTAQTATGLTSGNYTVTITDANGCTMQQTVTLNQPAAMTVNTTVVQPTCTQANGSATATPNGGNGPYNYLWNPSSQNTQTATGLIAGLYTVTVTDANGCSQIDTISITASGAPTVVTSIGTIMCNGGNTTATATPTGNGPFTYAWSPSAQTTQTATNLTSGTYTVTVTDVNGCSVQTIVIVSQPAALQLASTNVTNTSCGNNNGSATVSASGGTGNYTYNWQPSGGNSSSASGLSAGTYTVTVTDANGCTSISTLTIMPSAGPNPAFVVQPATACDSVCITLNATQSGMNYSWTFSNGNSSTQQNPSVCFYQPGTYNATLIVTDNNGCTATSSQNTIATVVTPPSADFTADPNSTTITDATINFTDNSNGALTWLWNFGDPANSTSNQQNPTFTYVDTGYYCITLSVTNQAGCTDTSVICIDVKGEFTFFAPNAFTPNSDGKNNTWEPKGVGVDPATYELFIFDRWGNMIWKTNQWGQGWDGKANGGSEVVQQDVYVWKCNFRSTIDGSKRSYVGHISVVK
jgi:gliding motility-associated-like protein